LDALVAAHAGVRRTAGRVLRDEVLDDVVAEALREVPDIEGDAETVGGAPRVHRILDRAAAAAACAQRPAGAREGEVDARDLVSGVDRAGGGDGGVHPAAHGRQYAH